MANADTNNAIMPIDSTPVRRRLAALLRQRRLGLGISQVDLASLAGVHQVAVSEWERGTCFPTIPRLLMVARQLGIDTGDLDELLVGDNGEAAA